jgi:hypothetical protein
MGWRFNVIRVSDVAEVISVTAGVKLTLALTGKFSSQVWNRAILPLLKLSTDDNPLTAWNLNTATILWPWVIHDWPLLPWPSGFTSVLTE